MKTNIEFLEPNQWTVGFVLLAIVSVLIHAVPYDIAGRFIILRIITLLWHFVFPFVLAWLLYRQRPIKNKIIRGILLGFCVFAINLMFGVVAGNSVAKYFFNLQMVSDMPPVIYPLLPNNALLPLGFFLALLQTVGFFPAPRILVVIYLMLLTVFYWYLFSSIIYFWFRKRSKSL